MVIMISKLRARIAYHAGRGRSLRRLLASTEASASGMVRGLSWWRILLYLVVFWVPPCFRRYQIWTYTVYYWQFVVVEVFIQVCFWLLLAVFITYLYLWGVLQVGTPYLWGLLYVGT